MGRIACFGLVVILGCGPSVTANDGTDTEGSSGTDPDTSTSTRTTTQNPTTTRPDSTAEAVSGPIPDFSDFETGTPPADCEEEPCLADILFVIDNSGTMAIEQANIAQSLLLLAASLESESLDVQVMFTTTDMGNPSCVAFEPPDYEPAMGSPISDACVDRLERFTGLGGNPVIPETCTDLCPTSVAPEGDPFIAFGPDGDNIPDDVQPADIDGDGQNESPAAQALACVSPQGIDGCGFESPLESMIQALNPTADWNVGERPFLREDASLVVAIVTDEADCSIEDFSVMSDETYMETPPGGAQPQVSSAICWNAGISCVGPDVMGIYTDCTAVEDGPMHNVSRYADHLVSLADQGKQVSMVGLVGVPTVTAHNPEIPFVPTAGGADELVVRDWINGEYPGGDILPAEWALGTTAADKEFSFGIGPGCTGEDGAGGFTGQAIPPVRVREVCEALNLGNGVEDERCCLESICDNDYAGAMSCVTSLIQVGLQ